MLYEIGIRLKQARKHLKLTQAQFAEPLGQPWNSIKNIETGTVKISSDLVIQIESVHNINMRWLLTGVGDIFLNGEPEAIGTPVVASIPNDQSIIIECCECHCKMQVAFTMQKLTP